MKNLLRIRKYLVGGQKATQTPKYLAGSRKKSQQKSQQKSKDFGPTRKSGQIPKNFVEVSKYLVVHNIILENFSPNLAEKSGPGLD